MARQAIRNEGDDAESRFLQLVSMSQKSQTPALGDAVVTVQGKDYYVEIKQCGTRSGTINQVRAIKYIPCVIWASLRNKWYIFPPNRLVKIAAKKNRGQHTEIPFESMNIGMPANNDIQGAIVCDDKELDKQIREAICEGERFPDCREAMSSLLDEIRQLKNKYIDEIENMFED